MKYFLFVVLIVSFTFLSAQQIELLNSGLPAGNKTSLRGVSVVTEQVAWVSGSKGAVGRTINGGKTWIWINPPGFEKSDFRDIEAFDAATAIIMAIDTPAIILKTVDGGKHWKKVYENKTAGMFLDAMEFIDAHHGIVVGDPVDGRFFIANTVNQGNSWTPTAFDKLPAADSGEGCFASSGTNIRTVNINEACFISGGTHSRFYWHGEPVDLPILQGQESYGANSIAIQGSKKDSRYFVVVGGDFKHDTSVEKNCVLSNDGGKTWTAPVTPPHGYRSCAEFISATRMIACGTSGIDVSSDAGVNWQLVNRESFHVCRKAKKGNSVYLAGSNGRIAKLIWP